MKRFPVILIIFVLAGLASVSAQDGLVANVPFDFIVAGKTLPAGEYRMDKLNPLMLKIRGTTGQGVAVSQAIPVTRALIPEVVTTWQPGPAPKNPNLKNTQARPHQAQRITAGYSVIFRKYGQTYFLADVWTGNDGQKLVVCQSEKALKTASISRADGTVQLAAALAIH